VIVHIKTKTTTKNVKKPEFLHRGKELTDDMLATSTTLSSSSSSNCYSHHRIIIPPSYNVHSRSTDFNFENPTGAGFGKIYILKSGQSWG